MCIRDSISFGLKSEKISKNEIKSKVIEAAKILKIEDLLERRPKDFQADKDSELLLEEP